MLVKRRILIILTVTILLLTLGFLVWRNRIRVPQHVSDDMWIPINIAVPDSKKTLSTYTISNKTSLPYEIKYPKGSVKITKFSYGQDIWTKDGLHVPGVVEKAGEQPILADFGMSLTLDNGDTLRLGTFRKHTPSGVYDEKTYKILGEDIIETINNSTERTKTITQYRLEVNAQSTDPSNPILQIAVVSENYHTGTAKALINN